MTEPKSRLSRRTLFAGAGTAGALATIATVLPSREQPTDPAAELKPAPERGGGYQLTEHVRRYYRSTRL